MNGWKVGSSPISTPIPRAATWTRMSSPAPRALSTRPRICLYCMGARIRCISDIDRPWPGTASAIFSSRSNSGSNRAADSTMSKSLTACRTPWSRPSRVFASSTSSFSLASAAGVWAPAASRWLSVRPVENPTAPASSASRSCAFIAAISASLAGSSWMARSPMAYTRSGSWGTRQAKSMVCGIASSASMYSGKVSHLQSMPSASAVPGMSSTPSISAIRRSRSPSRTGAKPTPQLPITAVVTPWKQLGASSSSQLTWPS